MKRNKEFENSVVIGDFSKVKSLIKKIDIDTINATDKYGRTVLYDAVVKGFVEIVIELCKMGANVNIQDKNGKTPLHLASIHNQFEIAKTLILYGANLNLKDENGNTPIFDAVFNSKGKSDIIILLKENKADCLTPNNYGISPKSLADSIVNYDLSRLFL